MYLISRDDLKVVKDRNDDMMNEQARDDESRQQVQDFDAVNVHLRGHPCEEGKLSDRDENIRKRLPSKVIPDKPDATIDIATGKVCMFRPPTK